MRKALSELGMMLFSNAAPRVVGYARQHARQVLTRGHSSHTAHNMRSATNQSDESDISSTRPNTPS